MAFQCFVKLCFTSETQTANDGVDTMTAATTPTRKRKCGDYNFYDRAKIARYYVENGVARAARKFSSDLGKKVSKTSVCCMRDTYLKLKEQGMAV
jgi:hypothetical protein